MNMHVNFFSLCNYLVIQDLHRLHHHISSLSQNFSFQCPSQTNHFLGGKHLLWTRWLILDTLIEYIRLILHSYQNVSYSISKQNITLLTHDSSHNFKSKPFQIMYEMRMKSWLRTTMVLPRWSHMKGIDWEITVTLLGLLFLTWITSAKNMIPMLYKRLRAAPIFPLTWLWYLSYKTGTVPASITPATSSKEQGK